MFFINENFSIEEIKMIKRLIITFRNFAKATKTFSEKSCRQNQYTHFMFITFVFENNAVCVIMWKNIVEPDKSQISIWHVLIKSWIYVATNIHSKYEIHIDFPP